MRLLLRLLGLVLAGSFLYWLWRDAQPAHKIVAGVSEGQIGGLTNQDAEAFREALNFLTTNINAKGVSIALNEPGEQGAIRVLTITDAGTTKFHCGPGNAVYDAGLDAVLIHVDLVHAWLMPEFGTTELFSPRKSFFVFLMLHELGHKIKQGSAQRISGTTASGGDRKLEEAADEYAFEQIDNLANEPLIVGPEARSPLAQAWKLEPGTYYLFGYDLVTGPWPVGASQAESEAQEQLRQQTARLRAQAFNVRRDLFFLSLMHAVPRAAMRGDSPYSSLDDDPAHPTLVNRLQTLLENYQARTSGLTYPRDSAGMWAGRSEGFAAVEQQISMLNQMRSHLYRRLFDLTARPS
jgi:hypothetical protein